MKCYSPHRRQRQLKLQMLETRRLLAANLDSEQHVELPEDVNADGQISSLDALMVINQLSRRDTSDDFRSGLHDVNGDGVVTSVDALRIINRIERKHGGDHQMRSPRDPSETPVLQNVGVEVRSIDGSGNNLVDPSLGSTGSVLRRLVDAAYQDGVFEPAGVNRPSAREVSNIVFAQQESILSERRLSDVVWQWGQFIDHDITLTGANHLEDAVPFPIAVPIGDPFFDPFGTGTQQIDLTRSSVSEGSGIDSPAEQINEITAFIDGSMVYGSSEDVAVSLRSFEGGRLRTSDGDLLPTDEAGFFLAGDVRANEQHGLTVMHTLFVREHNRLADEIASTESFLSDEEIYQRARKLVIAKIQAITFYEYLPALLGREAISEYRGYDANVDPTISNLFATAAFRYGHTSLSSDLLRLDNEGDVISEGNIALRNAFFNPTDLIELGIDPVLKGLVSNISQEIDTQLVDDVRNFLFGPPGAGGFDLASLNIQRGRDHGLPDYNTVRDQLGMPVAASFADITSDPELQAKLAEAYQTTEDVDVWVGALAEDHVPGSSVGELTRVVILEQFNALRDGDRFWFENVLTGQELREIRQTRLSDIIERNTELSSIQSNAFIVPRAAEDRPESSYDGRDLLRDSLKNGSLNDGDPHPPLFDLSSEEGGTAGDKSTGVDWHGGVTLGSLPETMTPSRNGARVPLGDRDEVSPTSRAPNHQEAERGGGHQGGLNALTVDRVFAGLEEH